MPLSLRDLAIGGSLSLLFASTAVQAAEPPNVPVVSSSESVAGCTSKGIISLNLNDISTGVPAIRSPEMRLNVAKMGGNVVLVLPSSPESEALPSASERGDGPRQARRVVSGSVYACPASRLPKAPAKGH